MLWTCTVVRLRVHQGEMYVLSTEVIGKHLAVAVQQTVRAALQSNNPHPTPGTEPRTGDRHGIARPAGGVE